MNEKEFRPFEFMRYFIEDTKIGDQLHTGEQTIDLNDVKGYHRFEFKDNNPGTDGLKFTLIETYMHSYVAKIPYEDFRGIHNEFLMDTGLYDPRTTTNYPLIK